MSLRIAVNGFGRIGRLTVRSALERGLDVVGVNDIADPEEMAHLFKYDTVHGTFPGEVELAEPDELRLGDHSVHLSQESSPSDLPWDRLDVDVAIESTGLFRDRDDAAGHLDAGADKVVISAPSKSADHTVVMGVNDDTIDPDQHHVVSNASCTTNCLAPVAKVLNDAFGIESGVMTTTHAYTGTQNLLDGPGGKDYARMRAAAENMVPTSTGAAKATTLVLPELEGKLDGMAIRVPVPNTSIVDLAARLETSVSLDDVTAAMKEAAEGPMDGILDVAEAVKVSSDYVGNPHSSIYDPNQSMVVNDNHAKILSWYDNEWGYSNRLLDLAQTLGGG